MDNGGSSECKMWLENVEDFVNSSSSADEHKSARLFEALHNTNRTLCVRNNQGTGTVNRKESLEHKTQK